MSTSPDTTQPRNNATSYFIHIQGLPSGYTWQELKDYVRNAIPMHGVWTDTNSVYPDVRNSGMGYVRLQRQRDTQALYNHLRRDPPGSRPVELYLWDISDPQPRLLHTTSSNNAQYNPRHVQYVTQLAQATGWIPFWPQESYGSPRVQSMYTPNQGYAYTAATQSTQPSESQLEQQARLEQARPQLESMSLRQQTTQQRSAQRQTYTLSSNGTLINNTNGLAIGELRGVFISNIRYSVEEKDIQAKFSKVGDVVGCTLQRDRSSGKSKGNAIVQYTTADGAKQAVDRYNGRKWHNRILEVRSERNPTTVTAPASSSSSGRGGAGDDYCVPTIVNGSVRCQSQWS